MSSAGRGRGGKFNKVKRGGGKKFSRDLQPLNADGEVVGMWGVSTYCTLSIQSSSNTELQEQPDKVDEESSDEEESSEEESDEEGGKPEQEELTREQRRELAKKRKAAAIAKKSQKTPEAGDMPTDSSEDEDDDMPANPNHTAKARTQATKAPVDPEAEPVAKGKGKQQDLSQLSRREREALQAQANKDRYDKLHAEGKTEQARADLERLKLVRERRDAEAARKKAEAEERAELEKEKKELMERENRRREQAKGKAERLAKGGKKKA